jgi:hypothetical protein
MGVATVVESKRFTHQDVQKLHDKIKMICGYVLNENISEKTNIYNYYYKSGAVSRDIEKIKAGNFKWNSLKESNGRVNKISKNQFQWESTMMAPKSAPMQNKNMSDKMVTKDRKMPGEKSMKIGKYPADSMMYKGEKVTDELLAKYMKMGIYLVPDSVK